MRDLHGPVDVVCGELCKLGNSVGFRCYFRDGVVYCLRGGWEINGHLDIDWYVNGPWDVNGDRKLLRCSELVLEVRGVVVVCSKGRWCNCGVVGELCDPGVFDGILGWFQVMAHRRDYGFG